MSEKTDVPVRPGGSPVPDFARRWKIPESTVWHWIASKRINVVKLGPRATRISDEEEARLIREGMSEGGECHE